MDAIDIILIVSIVIWFFICIINFITLLIKADIKAAKAKILVEEENTKKEVINMGPSELISRILVKLSGYYQEFFTDDEEQGTTIEYQGIKYKVFKRDLEIYESLLKYLPLPTIEKEEKNG